jgi:hypothetical protein
MKNKFYLSISLAIFIFSVIISDAYGYDSREIVKRAKRATRGLRTVKLKERSVTGSVNVTRSKGAMSYLKNEFLITEETDSTILRKIFFKDDVTYLYDGIFNNWIKFSEPVDFFAKPFNKDIWFSIFPAKPKELGLEVKLLEEEIVEGLACYQLRSRVADVSKAKFYISKFLGNFFPQSLVLLLRSDQELLDRFLDIYIRSLETTLWISKKTFYLIKISNRYHQMAGAEESVSIDNESIFYDFNKPIEINLPPEAAAASVVSVQDLASEAQMQ